MGKQGTSLPKKIDWRGRGPEGNDLGEGLNPLRTQKVSDLGGSDEKRNSPTLTLRAKMDKTVRILRRKGGALQAAF